MFSPWLEALQNQLDLGAFTDNVAVAFDVDLLL